ncbi:MAG: H-NS histone family protein [Burkholderiales bacterium]|nr:H-NS histone family protein [Burkholderiales bacterium]
MKDQLDKMSEEQLKTLIADAQALLNKREQEKKKAALDQIRKLAAQAGMTVAVKGKGRPGRKSAKKPAGS